MLRKLLSAAALALGCWLPLSAAATVVVDWNQSALAEVRLGRLGPPIVARALAITHACIYEAWAAYDERAIGPLFGGSLRRPALERSDANKAKAISFAAYRCLVNLFPAGASRLETALRNRGFDPADVSMNLATPQGIGNRVAQAVIEAHRNDGANQYGTLRPGAYADYTGYAPRNGPMPFCLPAIPGVCAINVSDPFSWQPLTNNLGVTQTFIAPHWERVTPFALKSATQYDDHPLVASGPNYLQSPARYQADIDQMIQISAALTPQQKLIVEYWADGPESELPPGHWSLFAQHVSRRDGHGIDADAKMFYALQGALHDAGIVAWHLKRKYNGVRPITAVRYFWQGFTIFAWGGPGQPNQDIDASKWSPYNPGSNLTPAFPGWVSGHSTFSAAGAAVLQAYTGSDQFGFATVIPANFGRVEPGVPALPTALSYATFSAAVQDAGLSRLYAGIHFADDNTVGQALGTLAGQQAWAKAQYLIDGGLAVDSSSSLVSEKVKRLSWPHTVAARSNRLLVVGVSYRDGNQPVQSVSYGGQPLARLGTQNAPGNQNRVELWYRVAPAVGSADVVVTLDNSKNIVGGAVSFTGVDQRSPFGILRSASAQTQEACVTLANAPADLVISVLAANGDAKSVTTAPGQVSAWNTGTGTAGGDIRASGSSVPAAPIATLCQALDKAKPWSLMAVPLTAALTP